MVPSVEFLASVGVLSSSLALAWAFQGGSRAAHRQAVLGRWAVLYIDANGELQKIVADVVGFDAHDRSMTLRHAGVEAAQTIKFSRVAEAVDVASGRRVLLDRWLAHVSRRIA